MQKTISIVNLKAIISNACLIKSLTKGKKFYAVVKADAYGHGGVEVALCLESIVDGFCVAIVDEGVALRVAGITKEILVFAPPISYDDVVMCNFYSLTPTVNSIHTAKLINGLPCHIKINSGMNRYGCNIDELDGVLKELDASQIVGVYSHLYAPNDDLSVKNQQKIFDVAVEKVKAKNDRAIAHLVASGGILRGDCLYNGVRCGICLYGYAPEGFKLFGLKKALKVYAPIVQNTTFCGGGAGYAKAEKVYNILHTVRLGYADGFNRICPLGIGNLCMDAFVSEGICGDTGSLVCILDDAEVYAKRLNTICYEVLCNVTRRSARIYER
jgi:alanine racemase